MVTVRPGLVRVYVVRSGTGVWQVLAQVVEEHPGVADREVQVVGKSGLVRFVLTRQPAEVSVDLLDEAVDFAEVALADGEV